MFVSFDMGTKYLAYARFDDGNLLDYGRVIIPNAVANSFGDVTFEVFKKFQDIAIDVVVYENGYLANSPKTLMDLSKITGAMLGGMLAVGATREIPVPPITWQTGIGVGRTSEKNRDILKKKYPNKSAAWIKQRDRENRKQLIIDFVNEKYNLNLKMDKNDEADAIALGHYAREHWNLT